ncbi:MAG: peptidoglycan binding domain-containing protein [Aggregatilineales bacterium]
MDESFSGARRKRPNRARERYDQRQRRREALASLRTPVSARMSRTYRRTALWREQAALYLRDAWWYVRTTPLIPLGAALLAGALLLAFIVSHLVNGRVFPNVWALGVNLGDMTADEAEAALRDAWNNRLRVRLIDDEHTWSATPAELGMAFDARAVVADAFAVGMAGIPLGWTVQPQIALDYITAQNYLLDLAQQVQVEPFNAGYALRDGQVVAVAGRPGRIMDVGQTMETLAADPFRALRDGLRLRMTPIPPDVVDATPYLEDARAFAARPFQLRGYDPYLDQTIAWGTTPEVVVSWLEAGPSSLTLRERTFLPFLEAQNSSLAASGQGERYLDTLETIEQMRQAIARKSDSVDLRIRYRPTQYTVVAGDTATRIARKTGIPFYFIEQSNPGRNLNVLAIGDRLNLPSRDLALPLPPVPHKRIIVDLRTQSLVAYENGQRVFSWLISSGKSEAPTSPGIYQILSHNEVASGSSYTLCNIQGCGQWKMYWFMGIYEVVPGLMNGFHGAVLLPNGAYLGGGNVGVPYTFGCIMSQDDNARLLYEWADEGTIVEIISNDFPPQSELARMAFG